MKDTDIKHKFNYLRDRIYGPFRDFIDSLEGQYKRKGELSVKQLDALDKYYRRQKDFDEKGAKGL